VRAGPGLVRGERGLRPASCPMAIIGAGCGRNKRPVRGWPANFGRRRQWLHGGRTTGWRRGKAVYRPKGTTGRGGRRMGLRACRRRRRSSRVDDWRNTACVRRRPMVWNADCICEPIKIIRWLRPPPLSSDPVLKQAAACKQTRSRLPRVPNASLPGPRPARTTSAQRAFRPARAMGTSTKHTGQFYFQYENERYQ